MTVRPGGEDVDEARGVGVGDGDGGGDGNDNGRRLPPEDLLRPHTSTQSDSAGSVLAALSEDDADPDDSMSESYDEDEGGGPADTKSDVAEV